MTTRPTAAGVLALAASLAMLVSGCSGGALPSAAPATPMPSAVPSATPSAAPSAAPTSAPSAAPSQATEPPSGAASSLEEVKGATIQIEAIGTFVDPEVGQMNNAAGRGSGFLIDPSGIAVTANHVVTGAAFLKVWVGGNKEVHNAKVLGASECSDLAVIKVEGADFAYLAWYPGKIDTGLDVYAAGFPLGDPEYTLRKGIVSKAKASGDTSWASIDSVIEHDAAANPGNSGGPLVTGDGQVVGVHFASDEAGERFAISEVEVMKVLDQLGAGKDVTSIGVNGQAVNDGAGTSGIWVSSVKSGSPADNAGVKPGDIITRLEGLVLSTDGTMADYCDILRSHNPGDVLSIQVLRYSTKEILEGQLNGRALQRVTSFGDEGGGGGDGGNGGGGEPQGGYVAVTDDADVISVEVPKTWKERKSGTTWDFEDEGNSGVSLAVAPSIKKFQETWGSPGLFVAVSRSMADKYPSDDAILDKKDWTQDCKAVERSDYSDGVFTGRYDFYTECGPEKATFIHLSAAPEGRPYVIYVQILAVTAADLDIADHIAQTMKVVGEVP
jgi:serine protease Do